MYLAKNGQVVNSGAGVAVWGHPAAAVARARAAALMRGDNDSRMKFYQGLRDLGLAVGEELYRDICREHAGG